MYNIIINRVKKAFIRETGARTSTKEVYIKHTRQSKQVVQFRLNTARDLLGSIFILNQINPIPRAYAYFFKIHSNILLGLPKRLFPIGLPVEILKELLPFFNSR